MMGVNLAIGFVTPPIGVNLFVASSLTEVPLMEIAKHALPMILYFLVALLIITFVPGGQPGAAVTAGLYGRRQL